VDLLWKAFIFLTKLLTNISTILATLDATSDVLAACRTVDVAFAVDMLYLLMVAYVRLFKRVSVTKTKLLDPISYVADHYQK